MTAVSITVSMKVGGQPAFCLADTAAKARFLSRLDAVLCGAAAFEVRGFDLALFPRALVGGKPGHPAGHGVPAPQKLMRPILVRLQQPFWDIRPILACVAFREPCKGVVKFCPVRYPERYQLMSLLLTYLKLLARPGRFELPTS